MTQRLFESLPDETVFLVDPEEGWKYGFPKPITKGQMYSEDFNIFQWLWDNGYPKGIEPYYVRYMQR